jgi:ATP phosphoribosyltransferase
VQVPEKGDITEAKQLVGRNVVTSFTALSRQFFANLEDVSERSQPLKTKIKYVGGSVEAACALGVADGIVDLVGMFEYFLYQPKALSTTLIGMQNPERP